MGYDLLLKNCKAVYPADVVDCSLAIKDGRIAALLTPDAAASSETTIDVGGRYTLPGLIDTHVHFGAGGGSFADDCRRESMAALSGGVTTIFHHLTSMESYFNIFEGYKWCIESESLVDVGFHAAIMAEEHIPEMRRYAEELGITSFKFFMAYKGGEIKAIKGVDDGLLLDGLREVGKIEGAMAIVHCENYEISVRLAAGLKKAGRLDSKAWSESRPTFCEEEAIMRASFLAGLAGCNMCVAHLSGGPGAINYILSEKSHGAKLLVETCPHYLSLRSETEFASPTVSKVNPPLRGEAEIESLWRGASAGAINFIGSDHCAFSLEEKGDNIWTSRAGLPGVDMILPVVLSEGVNKGGITICEAVRLTSFNAAKSLGLYPKKGILGVGSDADIVVVDIDCEKVVDKPNPYCRAGYTPYLGLKFKGWPAMTIAGGDVVYKDGELVAAESRGKYLARVKSA